MSAVLLAGILIAAAIAYLRARLFLASAVSADAEVIGLKPYSERFTRRYAQLLRFRVGDDVVETEFRSGITYDVGTRLVVLFKPGDATHVTIKPVLYRPFIILIVIAAVVLIGWIAEIVS